MGFKKTTTLVLFFLLLVTIVFFSAAVIVYQNSMTRLNDELRDRKQDIIIMQGQIDGLSMNFTGLKEAYGLQILREENLSSQFSNVKEAKESLEESKKQMQEEIDELTEDLILKETDINSLQGEVSRLNIAISGLNLTYAKVLDDVQDICEDAAALNISECRRY